MKNSPDLFARILALALTCASVAAFCPAAKAQTVAPGTGRYWKKNPPAPSTAPSAAPSTNAQAATANAKSNADQTKQSAGNAATVAKNLKDAAGKAAQDAQKSQSDAEAAAALASDKAKALSQARAAQEQAISKLVEQAKATPVAPAKGAKPAGAKAAAEAQQFNAAILAKSSDVAKANAAVTQAEADANQAAADAKAKAGAAATAKTAAAKAQADADAASALSAKAAIDAADAQTAADKAAASAPPASCTVINEDETGYGFCVLPVPAGQDLPRITISKTGDTDSTGDFKLADTCAVSNGKTAAACSVLIGFHTTGTKDETVSLQTAQGGSSTTLTGHPATGKTTSPGIRTGLFPLNHNPKAPEFAHPTIEDHAIADKEAQMEVDFGALRDMIDAFWNTNGQGSFLGQIKSIYNSAAQSNTVNADIADLNFGDGVQFGIATNIQSNSSNTTTPQVTSGTPTLSSAQAAQAAQSMANGGNLYFHGALPFFLVSPDPRDSAFQIQSYFTVRDGISIPNFAGTSTVVSDPANHFNISNETFAQYDGWQPGGGSDAKGSIFVDGRIGYNYISHEFARQGGFNSHVNSLAGQLSAGMIIAGKISFVAQRNFGPSQAWIDSTTNTLKRGNNFQTWSIGITYSTSQGASGSSSQAAKK